MSLHVITYIIMSTKVWSNTISIMVCLATLLYIIEKTLQHKNQLATYNQRLVFLLVFFCLMTSIANINVPISALSCHLIRRNKPTVHEPVFPGNSGVVYFDLLAVPDGDRQQRVLEIVSFDCSGHVHLRADCLLDVS
jgi:hypothetical protein